MEDYNILFICKHNVFRSQVAEAYFNQINKNEHLKATSGGLFAGHHLEKWQVEKAKELGVDMKGESKNITTEILKKQDLIIIVADNVPRDIIDKNVYDGEVMDWNIPDVIIPNDGELEKTINSIKENVENLVDKLKQK